MPFHLTYIHCISASLASFCPIILTLHHICVKFSLILVTRSIQHRIMKIAVASPHHHCLVYLCIYTVIPITFCFCFGRGSLCQACVFKYIYIFIYINRSLTLWMRPFRCLTMIRRIHRIKSGLHFELATLCLKFQNTIMLDISNYTRKSLAFIVDLCIQFTQYLI